VSKLDEIAALPEHWDSYGAKKPDPLTLERVRRLLSLTKRCEPLVFPTVDGGLQIDWRDADDEWSLTVEPDGSTDVYLKGDL